MQRVKKITEKEVSATSLLVCLSEFFGLRYKVTVEKSATIDIPFLSTLFEIEAFNIY